MIEENEIKILNVIYNEKKPIDAINISKKTNLPLEEICKCLIDLEKELKIRITKKGKYTVTDYLFGKLSITKSSVGFVYGPEIDDIFIKKSHLRNAIHGDNVVVKIIDQSKNEGKIIKVLSHDKELEIGQVIQINNEKYIKFDDIKKQKNLLSFNDNTLVVGHKVAVRVGTKIEEGIYNCEIVKIIGHVNDPGIDIISKAISHDIEIEFSSKALEEANKMPTIVRNIDLFNRKDLRDKMIFTIDGDDAKDLDDAVSIEILDNGNYRLGVHIADVSYYVKRNSQLDIEAYERGTSCYLADRVITMLPNILSNGICSLNKGVDRLAKTCSMEFNRNGNLINYDIFDSVINSKKRMTYKKVNDCLNNQNTDLSYIPFIESLKIMQSLSNILRKKRENNGSINFDTNEMKIVVDEYGKVIDVIKRERIDSEKLIEDFMIEANVTVATHISYLNMPFIYRTHGEPNNGKLEKFINFVKLMNERIIKLPKNLHSQVIKQLLESLKESSEFEIYSNLLLRCMQKAVYDVNNIGHFGLSLNCYTHFTSPIRRYPDLLVHRVINQYCNNDFQYDEDSINRQLVFLTEAAKHSSLKEQNADNCEREVNKMKSAEYMENHINEDFVGKITGVSEYGFYVDIYNGIEGLVKISDLHKGYYDKDSYTIYSNGTSYRIGDIVEVTLEKSCKETSQIDLALLSKVEKKQLNRKRISVGNSYE